MLNLSVAIDLARAQHNHSEKTLKNTDSKCRLIYSKKSSGTRNHCCVGICCVTITALVMSGDDVCVSGGSES
jgi:hypothetical protein